MPYFKSKPVVIEARRLPTEPLASDWPRVTEEIAEWCGGELSSTPGSVRIQTLEGTMRADPGDWVIKGTRGEFYPCKPDVFAHKYEQTDEEPAAVVSSPV